MQKIRKISDYKNQKGSNRNFSFTEYSTKFELSTTITLTDRMNCTFRNRIATMSSLKWSHGSTHKSINPKGTHGGGVGRTLTATLGHAFLNCPLAAVHRPFRTAPSTQLINNIHRLDTLSIRTFILGPSSTERRTRGRFEPISLGTIWHNLAL